MMLNDYKLLQFVSVFSMIAVLQDAGQAGHAWTCYGCYGSRDHLRDHLPSKVPFMAFDHPQSQTDVYFFGVYHWWINHQ